MRFALSFLALFLIFASNPGAAQNNNGESFDTWLLTFKQHAYSKGISKEVVDSALAGLTVNQRAIDLDRKQPEGKFTFAQYYDRVVNQTRIDKGRELYKKHYAQLKEVEAIYGVQPQYIVALWGIETNYGTNTGGFDVLRSLATLAWEGRRRTFFTSELINALKIIDQGHINRDEIKGSWAGALGQNQFMPSSFHNFAVDGNGDGKKDIWGDLDDVFASSSNYLSRSGWKGDERWGRRVKVPAGFSRSLEGLDVKKTLDEWQRLGITLPNGSALPVVEGFKASLIAPDGLDGQTFLVYNNFRTILKWNRSNYFATSVGLLADAIAQ